MGQQLHASVNFYELLGIDRQATEAEVRRAYRNLVKQYHPDVSNKPDTVKSFQLIQTAYEVLSDPQKRAIYDKLLYRREQGLDAHRTGTTFTRSRESYYDPNPRRRAYHAYTTARETETESRFEQLQFHAKQLVGVLIVTALFAVGLSLTGFGVLCLFVRDFNGAMVLGYVSTGAGAGLMVSVVKAFRVIATIWRNWFQNRNR